MSFLAVSAGFDESHDDVFCCHEGELLGDTPSDDTGVDDETFGDVLESGKNDVGGEESFGECDPAVGTVYVCVCGERFHKKKRS